MDLGGPHDARVPKVGAAAMALVLLRPAGGRRNEQHGSPHGLDLDAGCCEMQLASWPSDALDAGGCEMQLSSPLAVARVPSRDYLDVGGCLRPGRATTSAPAAARVPAAGRPRRRQMLLASRPRDDLDAGRCCSRPGRATTSTTVAARVPAAPRPRCQRLLASRRHDDLDAGGQPAARLRRHRPRHAAARRPATRRCVGRWERWRVRPTTLRDLPPSSPASIDGSSLRATARISKDQHPWCMLTGVMSGAMLFIQEDFNLSDEQVQLLTGIMNVSAIAGCLTAGHVSDYFGRRRTFSIAAWIFFIGSVLMSFAGSFGMLMAGRCVTGVAVSYALSTAPVYAAEISPAKTRGSLSSIPDISINFGILIGYVANYFLGRLPLAYGWRAMFGISALPSAVFAVGEVFLPESPRWLVMHGRVDEALDVLQQLCATGDEAQVLWSEAALPEEWSGGLGVWREMFLYPTPPVRRMLVAGMGVLFVQHLSGINGVQLYSARVFKAVGIASTNEILAANIGMGLAKTVFILTAILLVDRVGRRGLYLSSLAGVIVSLSCLGLSLTVIEHSKPNQDVPWPRAAIASVFTFVASFSIGLGPITGAYSSEVIPLRLRAQGVGVGVAFNRVANATVALTFISLSNAITMGGAFFLFGFLSVGAATFFYFFCPETQGRPLEEIEEVFRHGWRERRHNVHSPFHVFKHTETR